MVADSFCSDFEGSSLPDFRLEKRLKRISCALSPDPGLSFPNAFDEAGLEAAYRFFGNPRVSPDSILSGHWEALRSRAHREAEPLIVAHDTSDVEAPSVSFRLHLSLAIRFADRQALGVVSLLPNPRGSQEAKPSDAPNEQERWMSGVRHAESRLGVPMIHVKDREADDYSILSDALDEGIRFVIRARSNRTVAEEKQYLYPSLENAEIIAERTVKLNARAIGSRSAADLKANPPRTERTARLAISAKEVKVLKPGCKEKGLVINVVYVREICPPEGHPPVTWRLLTTEPIATPEQILFIVDAYRTRWVIEEFFKVLKSGCQIEKRQLEGYHAYVNAVAVLVPMALDLLALRTLAQTDSTRKASDVLSSTILAVLAVFARQPLPKEPTVKEAMMAIAALGGHLKRNGEPGWITLGRGYEKLLSYAAGWDAAMQAQKM